MHWRTIGVIVSDEPIDSRSQRFSQLMEFRDSDQASDMQKHMKIAKSLQVVRIKQSEYDLVSIVEQFERAINKGLTWGDIEDDLV